MQIIGIFLIALGVLGESFTLLEQQVAEDLILEEWEAFKAVYGKRYENDVEETFRLKIYLENRHVIAQHNSQNLSFNMVINQFGDMLFHEMTSIYNGFKLNEDTVKEKLSTFIPPANVIAPASIDWRSEGAVTPVKNQGTCGSCWAFGATGALEGQQFRKTGTLTSLSEQDLIDCAPAQYGCEGCEGGNPVGAFAYIKKSGGIDTESSYPYEAVESTCRFSWPNVAASVACYTQIPSGDEKQLELAVATVGPIVAAIYAKESFMRFGGSGIYYDSYCPSGLDILNHAVLVVGYGTQNGEDFWLVKNSWGSNWGDNGYIKMSKGRGNMCGIATYASYPLV